MALNLSTLTNSATSGDVLAEALTTADFLEPTPVLRNLSRGSNKGGDAKQDVALNQPKALPLIKNPQGNLGGYLYIPDVAGNYANGPSVTIGSNQTWEAEVDMVITQYGTSSPFKYVIPFGTQGGWNSGIGFWIDHNNNVVAWSKGRYTNTASGITLNTPFNIKYGFDGTNVFYKINDVVKGSVSGQDQSAVVTAVLQLNQQTSNRVGNFAIQKAKLTVNSSVVFDCDFNGSTSIRHGDTKFQASVGGPVTINQSGNDPATVIKKSVLRFDGTNDGLQGLFTNNIDSGYMFAAFSVLGAGGEANGRVFSISATGSADYEANGAIFGYNANGNLTAFNVAQHVGMFNDDNGDILLETKITNGSALSKVNNANAGTSSGFVVNSNRFSIATNAHTNLVEDAAIDLEFLALFPATITDAQADSVRNYINNRNNVFDLKDGFGYYFFDAQNAPVGPISSGSSSWNGRIVGSDNGDTNKYATQSTTNDQPVSDGYVVTFADTSDHLDIPSTTQAGWQIVGTSLGTFAYRVDNDAVTELNLLGNLGHANTRQVGQSYGILLLPESATTADLNAARKLLIDRGGLEKVPAVSMFGWFYARADIVNFQNIDLSAAVSCQSTWELCSSMISFGVTDIQNCNNFVQAWKGTNSLTSFPAGAKLGTAATNVNFQSAWRDSGLTSFSTPLPTAGSCEGAWRSCSALTDFNLDTFPTTNLSSAFNSSGLTSWSTELPNVENCNLAWYSTDLASFNISSLPVATSLFAPWYNTDLTSFSTELPVGRFFTQAWQYCSSLTDFSADVFANWNPSTISSGVFNNTWDDCTSLTAQSVENILTSIDASGHYATTNKVSGGSALGDAGIDIDYNVATGSLSAATNTAVTSLKSKGWSIIVNNVTL